MTILGAIWGIWATKDSIINAGKRVGITKDGLNVNDMQQDKFKQAASLIANQQQGHSGDVGPSTPKKQCTRRASTQASQSHSASQSATTPRSMSKMAKRNHRYGSVDYWKCMYAITINHSSEL